MEDESLVTTTSQDVHAHCFYPVLRLSCQKGLSDVAHVAQRAAVAYVVTPPFSLSFSRFSFLHDTDLPRLTRSSWRRVIITLEVLVTVTFLLSSLNTMASFTGTCRPRPSTCFSAISSAHLFTLARSRWQICQVFCLLCISGLFACSCCSLLARSTWQLRWTTIRPTAADAISDCMEITLSLRTSSTTYAHSGS